LGRRGGDGAEERGDGEGWAQGFHGNEHNGISQGPVIYPALYA
jgi:hypothetical protein